jgi:two-component system, OmpR family, response regulator
VLGVGEDAALVQSVRAYLESHGMSVAWAANGARGLDEAILTRPDAVLLDTALDGAHLCGWFRTRSDLPVIAITDTLDEAERVILLESGADDCLSKPLPLRELLARVRAQVRRARGLLAPDGRVLQIGALRIDPHAMTATMSGQALRLTTYEFKLLQGLAERAGRVLTREQLMALVRGSADEAFDRSIDSHVSRLRQKLGDDPRDPRIVKTVRGTGYLFAGAQSASAAE